MRRFFMNESVGERHAFSSVGREGIEITGVKDVVSFDENGVVLETACGSMAVEGEGLRVTTLELTSGQVSVEGRIIGVYYFDSAPKPQKGWLGIGKQRK
jgi:sporulation protein YabP